MEEYAVPRPTLKGSPYSDGNSFVGDVANPHHALQSKWTQLLQTKATQQGGRLPGDPLPMFMSDIIRTLSPMQT